MTQLEKTQLKNLYLSSYVSDSNQITTYVNDVMNNVNKKDYTALEVYPTTEDIPAGTKSDVEFAGTVWSSSANIIKDDVVYHTASDTVYKCLQACKGIEPTVTEGWNTYWSIHDGFEGKFYKYLVEVPASNVLGLKIYSLEKLQSDSDIVIDWGDGNNTIIANPTESDDINYKELNDSTVDLDDKRSEIVVTHTYSEDFCNRKLIVKIYGRKYCLLRCTNVGTSKSIVSRVFDYDLPLASNLTNVSSICLNSLKILQVAIPYGYRISASNIATAFQGCLNLRYFNTAKGIFTNRFYGFSGFVSGCKNLECNISNFDEIYRVASTNYSYSNIFYYCEKLYGTVEPTVYWGNPLLAGLPSNLLNLHGAFHGCPSDIRQQVPTSWSGTKV